jgi:hypothetical protein
MTQDSTPLSPSAPSMNLTELPRYALGNMLPSTLRATGATTHREHYAQQVLDAWGRLFALPAYETPRPGRHLLAGFGDRTDPIPFSELSLAFQEFILPPELVQAWYAPPDLPNYEAGFNLRLFSASGWRARTTTVAELAAMLGSLWAEQYVWPEVLGNVRSHSARFDAHVDIAALRDRGMPSAPIVVFEGVIHVACVTYALAVLRFAAPDAPLTFIEGERTGEREHGPVSPLVRYDQWSADGYVALLGPDDPDANEDDIAAISLRSVLMHDRAQVRQDVTALYYERSARGVSNPPLEHMFREEATRIGTGTVAFPLACHDRATYAWRGLPSPAERALAAPIDQSFAFERETSWTDRLPFALLLGSARIRRAQQAVALYSALDAMRRHPMHGLLREHSMLAIEIQRELQRTKYWPSLETASEVSTAYETAAAARTQTELARYPIDP